MIIFPHQHRGQHGENVAHSGELRQLHLLHLERAFSKIWIYQWPPHWLTGVGARRCYYSILKHFSVHTLEEDFNCPWIQAADKFTVKSPQLCLRVFIAPKYDVNIQNQLPFHIMKSQVELKESTVSGSTTIVIFFISIRLTFCEFSSFWQVSYYVDGESGFVPTITYTDGYTRVW